MLARMRGAGGVLIVERNANGSFRSKRVEMSQFVRVATIRANLTLVPIENDPERTYKNEELNSR